jgi:hypothetical protein
LSRYLLLSEEGKHRSDRFPTPLLACLTSSLVQSSDSSEKTIIETIHRIPLSQLPSLLSQLLIHNITLANHCPALKSELQQLQQSNAILLQKSSSTHAMNSGLQQSIKYTQEQVAYLNQTKQSTEEELRHQAEEATELVEKQNALIMSLEAKVCSDPSLSCLTLFSHLSVSVSLSASVSLSLSVSLCSLQLTDMRRKMLLKGSQVTSLQQRELTMQKKLYQTLVDAYENITIHFSMTLPYSQSLASSSSFALPSEVSLPELLNITRSCFEDIIKWDPSSVKVTKYEQEEGQRRELPQHHDHHHQQQQPRFDREVEGMRRKPPVIPRR